MSTFKFKTHRLCHNLELHRLFCLVQGRFYQLEWDLYEHVGTLLDIGRWPSAQTLQGH